MFNTPTSTQSSETFPQPWSSAYEPETHIPQPAQHVNPNDMEMLSWLQSMPYARSRTSTPLYGDFTSSIDVSSAPTSYLPKMTQVTPMKVVTQARLPGDEQAILCMACGNSGCNLSSHAHYSRHMARLRSPTSSLKSSGTLKQYRIPLRPLDKVPPALPSNMEQRSNSEQQYLLGLWSQKWSAKDVQIGPEKHLFPIHWIDKALPIASKDTTLRHALCAFSAISFSITHEALKSSASTALEIAVYALSQACPNVSSAIKDENLLAAGMLALTNANLGDDLNFKQHYERLVQLVRRRGGLYYLGMSGLVAETLMHVDYLNSVMYSCELVWTVPMPALDLGLPPQQGRAFRSPLMTNDLDMRVTQAACSLAKVVDILCLYGQPRAPAAAIASWGYLRMVAECQLAACNAVFHDTSTLDECVCKVLNLLNLAVIQFDGFIIPLARKVESEFWKVLSLVDAKADIIGSNPALYIWMLTTGVTTLICDTCEYRVQAISKIRVVSQLAGFHSWHMFKEEVLDKYLWLPSCQEEAFAQVWLDAASLPAITT